MASLSVRDLVVGESDPFVDVVVRLDAPATQTVTVNYGLAQDTASNGFDFRNVSGTLTFAPGETVKTVRVDIVADTTVESLEQFRFNLSSPVNATIAQASAMIAIVDNDTVVDTPRLFVRDVVIDEKDGTATFAVTLGAPSRGTRSNSAVTVQYATADLTATAGSDYVAKSGTLTFAPGETVKLVVVDLLDDALLEGFERFALNLSNPQGAVLTEPQARATIAASDAGATSQPRISVQDMVVGEGDGYVDVVVSLSAPGQNTVTVNYGNAQDTASNGFDFRAASGTLTFAPGEVSKTVRMEIVNDTTVESLTHFRLNLSGAVNATIAQSTAMIAIVDNDTVADTPALFLRDVVVDEKDGTASFVVTLGPSTRGTISNSTVSVNYSTADLTATAGLDYVARSGTLVFSPGETSKTVVIDLLDDALAEGYERFALNLSNPQGAVLTNAQARATIAGNDDTPTSQPRISVEDVVVGEADGYVDVVVNLSAPGQNVVTVNYGNAQDTASNGFDFRSASGTLTFAPGETSKTVRMEIVNDTTAESHEHLRLNLSGAVNATIAQASSMVTIVDNDVVADTPRVFVRDVVVDEKDGTAAFVVTLGPSSRGTASNSTVTVNYATADLTATAGLDYAARSGTLVFSPGETSKTVLIDILDDGSLEGYERFALNLSNPVGAVLTEPQARATIAASDATATSQPRITVQDVVVGEGDAYVDVVVSLSAPGQNTVTVNYGNAQDTASNGFDFRSASGTLTFAPGEVSKTVRMEIVNDTTVEGLTHFRLNLSGAVNATIAEASAMIAIVDNDTVADTPALFVRDVVVDEKDGTASFVVTLGSSTRGTVSNSSVSVNYSTADLTATAGLDYVARSGTLVFSPGETSKTVVVDLLDDGLTEPGERFTLLLSGAINASIGDGRAAADILANDGVSASQPSLRIQDTLVGESDGFVDMVVSLSAPGRSTITVNYANAQNTASNGFDFRSASGTLSFAAGEVTKVVRMEIVSDTTVENTESFRLNLSSAVGATIANTSALISIVDDDAVGQTQISFGRSDDVYEIGNAATTSIVENPGGGIDTVRASVSYTLPANVEALVLLPGGANGVGNESNNLFRGNAANNGFEGLAGIDGVYFSGPAAAYAVTGNVAQRTVTSAAEGSDTLLSIERLHFSDRVLASDTTPGGNVYAAYALFNAGFNRAPSTAELSQWVAQLDRLGSPQALAQEMINFYAPGVPDDALVAHLWSTIVGTAITPGDLATFVGLINNGTYTQASLLEFVSTYPLNTVEIAGIVGGTLDLDPAFFPFPG